MMGMVGRGWTLMSPNRLVLGYMSIERRGNSSQQLLGNWNCMSLQVIRVPVAVYVRELESLADSAACTAHTLTHTHSHTHTPGNNGCEGGFVVMD